MQVESLQQRQAEGGRLARAGLRAADDVATLQRGWNGGGLDRRGLGVAAVAHGLQQGGREAERRKGGSHECGPPGVHAVSGEMAERVGFEPTVPVKGRRSSRPTPTLSHIVTQRNAGIHGPLRTRTATGTSANHCLCPGARPQELVHRLRVGAVIQPELVDRSSAPLSDETVAKAHARSRGPCRAEKRSRLGRHQRRCGTGLQRNHRPACAKHGNPRAARYSGSTQRLIDMVSVRPLLNAALLAQGQL